MANFRSFRDVIDLWPSLEALASDADSLVPTVVKWRYRDSIPVAKWSAILETKVARDSDLTSDALTKLAAREPAEAR